MASSGGQGFIRVLTKVVNAIWVGFTAILMLAILILIPLQVFCRFVLDSSLDWPDELSPYILAWVTFFGGAIAMYNDEHVSFDYFANKFDGKMRIFITLMGKGITLAFLAVLLFYSVPLVMLKWSDEIYTMKLSKGLVYMCIPVGTAAFIMITARKTIQAINEYRENKEDGLS